MEVAERAQGTTQIVFVTAYDEHAIAAFEQGAADYILKPIKRARLTSTVERLRERLAASPAASGSERPRLHWIQATTGSTLRFFPVHDVCYFQSDGKYTRLVTGDAEAYIRRSLIALLRALDPEVFWQINRGIVVNVQHIESVTRETSGEILVRIRKGKAHFPVSKTHQSRFRAM